MTHLSHVLPFPFHTGLCGKECVGVAFAKGHLHSVFGGVERIPGGVYVVTFWTADWLLGLIA